MAPVRNIRVLIAPLDWGLGHATRCIPIVKALVERGIEVIIASDGPQMTVLSSEFPAISFVRLPGYKIIYGRTGAGTYLRIFRQLPGIFRNIRRENRWLTTFSHENRIDAIISDNRYGLHQASIPSIFITHQLYIKTGMGTIADRCLFRWHLRQIKKFDACWVPDYRGDPALAGTLSHPPEPFSLPVDYIGTLVPIPLITVTGDRIPLLIILSGPEPQRTMLEHMLVDQLNQFPDKVVFIRGLPQKEKSALQLPAHIEVHNHLSREELFSRIERADFVMARCGYTTVMELLRLKKKSLLIPTPGQSEQRYLARHLSAKKWVFAVSQNEFQLKAVLEQANNFNYVFPEFPGNWEFTQALDRLITAIKIRQGASGIQRKESF